MPDRTMIRHPIKVFFDGGCRPNPGPIEVAAVIRGQVHVRDDLGIGSSHDAEWLALIHAVELCHAQNLDDVVLTGDALAVITEARQLLASHADGQAADGHGARFIALRLPEMRVRWIKRQQNLAGIALAARHPR